MADAMVNARMSQSKKDAGNRVLRELGYNASQAINELYDHLLETHTWPLAQKEGASLNHAQLAEALSFVDGIAQVSERDFVDMSPDEAKRSQLIAKGRASEADFA